MANTLVVAHTISCAIICNNGKRRILVKLLLVPLARVRPLAEVVGKEKDSYVRVKAKGNAVSLFWRMDLGMKKILTLRKRNGMRMSGMNPIMTDPSHRCSGTKGAVNGMVFQATQTEGVSAFSCNAKSEFYTNILPYGPY